LPMDFRRVAVSPLLSSVSFADADAEAVVIKIRTEKSMTKWFVKISVGLNDKKVPATIAQIRFAN
jgi:hypothetical protein